MEQSTQQSSASFNMAISYLTRLDDLCKRANFFALSQDYPNWKLTLDSILREIYHLLKKDEITKVKDLKGKINKTLSNLNEELESYQEQETVNQTLFYPSEERRLRSEVVSLLDDYDTTLRDCMWTHQLMMKKAGSPGSSVMDSG